MTGVRPLVAAAFCLVISILLTILACTVVSRKNAWPLLCLVLNGFAVVPFYLCGGSLTAGVDDDDDLNMPAGEDMFNAIGMYIGGALLITGPGLAVVLWHTGVITGTALTLSLASAGCFLLTCLALRSPRVHYDNNTDGYDL